MVAARAAADHLRAARHRVCVPLRPPHARRAHAPHRGHLGELKPMRARIDRRPGRSGIAGSATLAGAVADGRPFHPWALKPVPQRGTPSAVPSNPNSRLGRKASPIAQGGVKMDATFVGIDVSKDRLDVHVRPSGEAFAVPRNGKGLSELALIAVEATGGFETIVAAAIAGAHLPLAVVNPAQVRYFAQAVGRRAKTDPIDAAVIAHFAEAVKPEPRELPDEAARLLAELVSRRAQLIEMVVAERQREKRASSVRVRKSLARHIAALEKELPVIDRDIDTMVRGSPLWREKEDLLVTFPGVGNTIARSVLADVPELGRLDRRKIASLIGVAPFTRRSGKWKGKSMIGGGRPAARSAIFLAALSAIRCNPVLRAFYQRLLAQGKPKMVALIAVARKIVTILNAMLRDKKQWQPA